jgi:NAD(P)-dependent dehydrogenase (short-subunit alcohol dehydrogenase family)
MNTMRLRDKVALISGAANGMGRATAATFAREGATAVVADVDDDGGAAVVEEIRAAGGRARYLHLDVTDEGSWTAAVDEVLGLFGRLDVLVNNAGISGTFDPDPTSTDFYDRLMLVNAKGVFLGIKHGAAAMARSGGGSIVNLSSISASIGQRGVHMGYGASKAAVKAMTTTAAVHLADQGIRVNAVAPGMLPPMRTSRGSADPAWRAQQIAGVPMGRAGEVREVADVVLFLACDESSYVTGVEILVDGGLTSV